jgi:hypothetical protein
MESLGKLKILIATYLVILAVLLLSVIAMPLLVRHGIALTQKLFLEEQSLESILILTMFGVSFVILRGFRRTLGAYELAVSRAGLDTSRLLSRLNEAFRYIGSVNVEIKAIQSIVCGVKHYPRTKKEFKRLLDQMAAKVMTIAGSPWVAIRMIDRRSGRTVKEHFMESRAGVLPSATIGNREILEGRRADGLRTIGARQENLDFRTVCILPAKPLTEETIILITAIANQIEMMFLIYRDGCAPWAHPAETDKPIKISANHA